MFLTGSSPSGERRFGSCLFQASSLLLSVQLQSGFPAFVQTRGQQEATYENSSDALIAGREQLSGKGRKVKKQSGALQASESILGLKAVHSSQTLSPIFVQLPQTPSG